MRPLVTTLLHFSRAVPDFSGPGTAFYFLKKRLYKLITANIPEGKEIRIVKTSCISSIFSASHLKLLKRQTVGFIPLHSYYNIPIISKIQQYWHFFYKISNMLKNAQY